MKSKYLMIGADVCVALFLFSGVMLYRQYADEKQSAEAFDNIAALVQDETPPADEPQETEPPQPEQTAFEKYAAVYEQNSDFVGWISIEGTNIDYPVMQTVDNPNYYLKRSFEKQYSDYGVPYVQENCDLGLSDNCVIYGHHMNNGSMFADLCKYADEDFYREHKTIRFDTLSGFGEYEVVAAFKTVAYSEQGFKYYHFVNAEDENAFNEYISQCKELALYDTGVTAEFSMNGTGIMNIQSLPRFLYTVGRQCPRNRWRKRYFGTYGMRPCTELLSNCPKYRDGGSYYITLWGLHTHKSLKRRVVPFRPSGNPYRRLKKD